MQDSEKHPGEEEYDPVDEINRTRHETLYVYQWHDVQTAVAAICEMYPESLEKTWVIMQNAGDNDNKNDNNLTDFVGEKEQRNDELINVIIE